MTARRRAAILIAAGAALALLAWSAVAQGVRPVLVYNPSPSAPVGIYRVEAVDRLRVGELVLVPPPARFCGLIAARGYLPPGVPLIKRVAALPGDHVCAARGGLRINATPVIAQTADRDSLGRPLPVWRGCRRLRRGEVFALMAGVPNSLDSRHLGPLAAHRIIGRVTPLWTF